jgi:N-acetyl-alpha-D-muramate 1-phosphate uridylyltransferase
VLAEVGERATVSDERVAPRAGPGEGPLGTAGALAALRDWVDGRDVLLTNADAYLPGGLTGLPPGWDGERCRLLCGRRPGHGDFGDLRYVGACLLPWPVVAGLEPRPSGLYEVIWRAAASRGRLDLVDLSDLSTGDGTAAVAIDAGTPAGYLGANLHASGGRSVVGDGAVVEGRIERCVVWDGAWVGPVEHLVDAVRAGTRHAPVTVAAGMEATPVRPFP